MAADGVTMRRRILGEILLYTREQGYPPTVRELGAAVGLASKSTVMYDLRILELDGQIGRAERLARGIRLTEMGATGGRR